MQDNFSISFPSWEHREIRNTALHIPEITGNMAHCLHKHSWPDLMMEILLQERLFTLWFAQNELEKPVIRLFEVPHREASTGCISCSAHTCTHTRTHTQTHMLWQPGEQEADSCKQMEKHILKEMILMYYSCQRGKKIPKWSISSHWSQVIIHTLVGQPWASQGWGKPLYIPLRSTWLNRWYICMLICLISLLQMSYRHIKGLTLRHNDIRASDGGLWKHEAVIALNLLQEPLQRLSASL